MSRRGESLFSTGLVVLIAGGVFGGFSAGQAEPPLDHSKIHPTLLRLFSDRAEGETVKAWVFFKDKAIDSAKGYDAALAQLGATYNARAIERRRDRRTSPELFDWHDIPVAGQYVAAIEAVGAKVHVTSRWLNGISVRATAAQIDEIARLSFVQLIEPVRRGRRIEPTVGEPVVGVSPAYGSSGSPAARSLDYGFSQAQLEQINLIALHDLDYTGAGVVIGILDSGFERNHEAFNNPEKPLVVVAEWDFVNDDPYTGIEGGDFATQHSHGTRGLGVIAAYIPTEFIGGAFDASFILCKTEDDTGEYPGEEDNYVGGLEFIESNGGDVATSSLGYIDWYTAEDYDGQTSPTAIATNIATANGIHCCKSVGNGGHDTDPGTWHMDTPADAFKVIACGSVDDTGRISNSSSDGPTVDGRVKPEVLARGVNTVTVDPFETTGYTVASGTSFSVPLVASAVACLVQAHPTWTIDRMRSHLFHTADYYLTNETFDPIYVLGYGVIDALAASAGDCNGNGIDDEIDIAGETSVDCNENGVPDECDLDPAGDSLDCNENGYPDDCDIAQGTSSDTNANGIPDECDADPPAAAPAPYDAAANRYVSFDPLDYEDAAFQVEMIASTYFPESGGVLGWVGEPDENGISRIASAPVTRSWTEPVVHLGDCAIVPAATYGISTIVYGDISSEPLLVSTIARPAPKYWGDVAGSLVEGEWTPPNGVVNMDDVVAAVQRFQQLAAAPPLTWVDVDEEVPNAVLNFTDIMRIVQGFKGEEYPFSDPAVCP